MWGKLLTSQWCFLNCFLCCTDSMLCIVRLTVQIFKIFIFFYFLLCAEFARWVQCTAENVPGHSGAHDECCTGESGFKPVCLPCQLWIGYDDEFCGVKWLALLDALLTTDRSFNLGRQIATPLRSGCYTRKWIKMYFFFSMINHEI